MQDSELLWDGGEGKVGENEMVDNGVESLEGKQSRIEKRPKLASGV